ncbi:testis-expressed protein 35 isoform X2 [Macrotis lagotis]|uniref:testis-expressed protein 35 isoform X2 n=1 Tax=Macrotis lagotis TaxID=92651 RepID=UPI003D69870E
MSSKKTELRMPILHPVGLFSDLSYMKEDRTNFSYLPLQSKSHRQFPGGMERYSTQNYECKGLKQEMMLAKKGAQDLNIGEFHVLQRSPYQPTTRDPWQERRREHPAVENSHRIKDIMNKDFNILQDLVDLMKDMQKDMAERMEALINLQIIPNLKEQEHTTERDTLERVNSGTYYSTVQSDEGLHLGHEKKISIFNFHPIQEKCLACSQKNCYNNRVPRN